MRDATPLLIVTFAVAASALLTIRAEYRGPRWQVYLFKPLTTTLVLALALLNPASASVRYDRAVVVGLLFSLAGDVFLMLPGDRFVAGLASFLLAHLAYLVAFTDGAPFGGAPWLLLPYLAASALLLRLLWPRLGALRVPVLAYVAVIVAMAWQAAARAAVVGGWGTRLAAVGAALFVASDATLALDRFRARWRGAQAVILSTYFAAQTLIALSAAVGSATR